MRGRDELQPWKNLLERGDQANLPGRVEVDVDLVDQHRALHVGGLDGLAGVEEYLPHEVGQPGDQRLISLRQPCSGHADALTVDVQEVHLESLRIRQVPARADPASALQLERCHMREQLSCDEDGFEHLDEGAAELVAQELDESSADEALAEERPQSIEGRFTLPRCLSCAWQETTGAIAGDKPVGQGSTAGLGEGGVQRLCFPVDVAGIPREYSIARFQIQCCREPRYDALWSECRARIFSMPVTSLAEPELRVDR